MNLTQYQSVLKTLSKGFLDVIYPPFCLVCDSKLMVNEKAVCSSCWTQLTPVVEWDWKEKITFGEGIDKVMTGWYFDDLFQTIIHNLKYQEFRIIAKEFGIRLAKMFKQEISNDQIEVVIPISLHKVKLKQRGFNQSALIASPMARELHIEYRPNLVIRHRNTVSQTSLGVDDRRKNVSGAFRVKDLEEFKRFLIVDDVLTTGATLSACAQSLRKSGAHYISVITAGTPKKPVVKQIEDENENDQRS